MSHTINAQAISSDSTNSQGLLKRSFILFYGIFSYVAGVGALMWILLGMAGLAPIGLSEFQADTVASAAAINLLLISLFGIQHSVMARPGFKAKLTKLIPHAAERATFMLATGIVTSVVLYFWQSVPGVVWQVENSYAQIAMWTVFALGWSYLLIASFVTNHFELMGLRQVYLYFRDKPYTELPFTNKLMYRYSRHPMMLGFILGLWSVPMMSVSHFVLASLFSIYVAIGIFLEERDLVNKFGETYKKYKKEIATFIPGMY